MGLQGASRLGPNKGGVVCDLFTFCNPRLDHRPVNIRWFNLEKLVAEGEQTKGGEFKGVLG